MSSNRYHTPGWGTFAFLTGIVVGGIAAILVATDDAGNTHPEIKKRIAKSKARIRANMTNVSDTYLEARNALELKLKTIKQNVASIDKSRYVAAVNDVIAEMKKSGSVTSRELGNIKAFLLEDYSKLSTPITKKSNQTSKG